MNFSDFSLNKTVQSKLLAVRTEKSVSCPLALVFDGLMIVNSFTNCFTVDSHTIVPYIILHLMFYPIFCIRQAYNGSLFYNYMSE